jgi:hypothetical protein
MLAGFLAGEISVPKNDIDLSAFAHALHGLPDDFEKIAEVRPIVLECLKRDKEEKHRTQIYRAASGLIDILSNRVDESRLYRFAPVASDVPERSVQRAGACPRRRRP